MILGTAGHVDHGKTALVRALTGVDTDRLPEEKRRGMTIELGFAPLVLEGVGTLGIVDVPGHEAFVRTMVAGASGIDIALLVIAADEGVMPQTREHVAILDILGVSRCVIALTKTDLAEPEWTALVADEARTLVRGTSLEGAEVVPVSAQTGFGLDVLRAALADVASASAAPPADDLFRMPVDRVFTLRGTGTVVTGTVWSGALRAGRAWVYPPGRVVRVKELQSHDRRVEVVTRGMRAALALADAKVEELARGATIVTGDGWSPTDTLIAQVTLLHRPTKLTSRTRVQFHAGSTERGARVVALGNGQARIHLDGPILCRGGDRFVLRAGSPLGTIGGGLVLDPFARRRARALGTDRVTADAVLNSIVREAATAGVEYGTLPVRLGVTPVAAAGLVRSPDLTHLGGSVYSMPIAEGIRSKLAVLVEEWHEREELSPGLPVEDARAALDATPELFDWAATSLLSAGRHQITLGHFHRAGWQPRLGEGQSRMGDLILAALTASPDGVLSDAQIQSELGPVAAPVVRFLERTGMIVRLGHGLVATRTFIAALEQRLRMHMADGRERKPADLREPLKLSRKVLIPFLEYCDRVALTERRGAARALRPNSNETSPAFGESKL